MGCKDIEFLRHFHCFSESFPYWCAPFNDRQVSDYKVGHRVLNLNSVRRAYVPFGLRGTVVGKTNDKVIVMFDEQYLGGSDLNGFCQDYRGALVDPNYLCNVTLKFQNILRKNGDAANMKLLDKFTEKKAGVDPVKDMQEK